MKVTFESSMEDYSHLSEEEQMKVLKEVVEDALYSYCISIGEVTVTK
ncbi:hypothetical protein vBBceHLY2_00055 [Bacillus phage vB_BceH_LY2]|nr:hypothetical protein vBBceHLY2_00055 [Bacillus phage vB_BceH_LY2]